jgi:hypothetical protein
MSPTLTLILSLRGKRTRLIHLWKKRRVGCWISLVRGLCAFSFPVTSDRRCSLSKSSRDESKSKAHPSVNPKALLIFLQDRVCSWRNNQKVTPSLEDFELQRNSKVRRRLWRTDTANQRGGSEWESIKILLKGDRDSNKTNTASNTRLRLTTQVGQARVATEVLLDLGTNKQPSEPKRTNTHNGNLHGLLPVLHRSDRWPAPVRLVTPVWPVDRAGQAGGYNNRTTSIPESLSDFSRP